VIDKTRFLVYPLPYNPMGAKKGEYRLNIKTDNFLLIPLFISLNNLVVEFIS